MKKKAELLRTRFLLNMSRVNSLVRLLFSSDSVKPAGIFRSEGVRADLYRSIVVFLHATFEVVLRSHMRELEPNLTFSGRPDLDKALRRSGIDAAPFKRIYPPLTQMAKRRHRIVHYADLPRSTDTSAATWGIVDEWQLIMWLMAVPAFYYQLHISVGSASALERVHHARIEKVMQSHVAFAKQLLAFPEVSPELRAEALERIAADLHAMSAALGLDLSDLEHGPA